MGRRQFHTGDEESQGGMLSHVRPQCGDGIESETNPTLTPGSNHSASYHSAMLPPTNVYTDRKSQRNMPVVDRIFHYLVDERGLDRVNTSPLPTISRWRTT